MNDRQIVEKALKVRDKEIKSFIYKHNEQDKDNEKYAEIAYFVETNIDVMKYKFKHLSMNETNRELHEYIKVHIPHTLHFKKIDKLLFKHRIYDRETVIYSMFLFLYLAISFALYYNFSNFNVFEIILTIIIISLLSFCISLCLYGIIFEVFKFKLYRIPKLNDL